MSKTVLPLYSNFSHLFLMDGVGGVTWVSFDHVNRILLKSFQKEANTPLIAKIALKIF